jgi:hypothetical protein
MERIEYDYLNVRELKVVCKFYKIDIPPRAKRDELEALIILAQTRIAMATIEAFQYYMANESNITDEGLADISNGLADISNGLAKG